MTTSLRVSEATRMRAAALAKESGRTLGELVDVALDDYERARFWEKTQRALALMPPDDAERAEWDSTTRDGLADG